MSENIRWGFNNLNFFDNDYNIELCVQLFGICEYNILDYNKINEIKVSEDINETVRNNLNVGMSEFIKKNICSYREIMSFIADKMIKDEMIKFVNQKGLENGIEYTSIQIQSIKLTDDSAAKIDEMIKNLM